MVNISLPIGKGITKFPNLKLSKPEFRKGIAEKQAGSDIEFFKIMADRGRLVFSDVDTTSNSGSMSAITPNNGDTFYFLGGSWQMFLAGNSEGSIELRNDGISRERISHLNQDPVQVRGAWELRFDALIGDGVKSYDLLFTEVTAAVIATTNIYGYILPSETLSSRGTG